MWEIIFLALIAGLGLALSIAVIGNFIVWNRMSYLADSISHSSIIGIALGLISPLMPELIIIVICFVFSFVIVYLNHKFNITKEALLIINTQFSVALGITLISLLNPNIIINNYFFGNILGVSIKDVICIMILALLIIMYLIFNWNKILLISINEEIAISERIHALFEKVIFVFLASCAISFSIKMVGVLLIPSIMIIPSIIALNVSKTPLENIVFASIVGFLGISCGILLSTIVDVPTGPLITLCLIALLIISILSKKILPR